MDSDELLVLNGCGLRHCYTCPNRAELGALLAVYMQGQRSSQALLALFNDRSYRPFDGVPKRCGVKQVLEYRSFEMASSRSVYRAMLMPPIDSIRIIVL